ncbi:MAG: ATP-binding protein, partial [Methylomonas sp.]|nr:ATP-binding protein [Methylomonas sp.]
RSDEAKLRQILINLIGNAVKFTEEGGVTLRLGLKADTPARLLIEVEDSGPGIAPDDRSRLFEPFVQLTDSALQRGTGLGLTITRQFVQMLGGSLRVESMLGKGSLFRVELPVEFASAADVLVPDQPLHRKVVGLAPGQPCFKILIVEDQRENQLLLTRLMTDIGLEVKVAENGEQGLQVFEQWKPDLIWMDRRMPVMDGIEATRRIRALPEGRHVKIVAVTASAFEEQQQEMLDAGMDDFVRKPYRFDEIYQSLARQLGVEYLYDGGLPEENTFQAELTADQFGQVPVTLRQALREALIVLDTELISDIIGDIAEVDGTLGSTLARLAENLDYAPIADALDRFGEMSSD